MSASVRVVDPAWIPLSDGTRLCARIWRPEDAQQRPVPAILEYLPYRKDDVTAAADALVHPYFAARGYAAVRVDIRGSGDSDGVLSDEYSRQEGDDALEVIAWLARQPWCTGAVGMMGISWSGFNSLQVAARRPPALRAIITTCSSDDRYDNDVHYYGGLPLGYYLMPWSSVMLAFNARPPDPAIVGKRWREMWLERLHNNPHLIEAWLAHQHRDEYWRGGSICEDYGAIECAVLAVGGWADAYVDAILRMLERLRCPRRAIVGPWGHQFPMEGAPGPAIGFLQEAVRWWDHWLKDEPTGVTDEPLLRAWMQEPARAGRDDHDRPGRWVAEEAWPRPEAPAQEVRLALDPSGSRGGEVHAGGAASGSIVHSSASAAASPPRSASDRPRPQPAGRGPDRPARRADRSPLEPADHRPGGRRVVRVRQPRRPASRPARRGRALADVRLGAAGRAGRAARPAGRGAPRDADRPAAFVMARLCDVAPDGAATVITRGAMNLCHRDGRDAPRAVIPSETMRVAFTLKAVGYALAPGHRVRLALSTSYWPWLWPSPRRPRSPCTPARRCASRPGRRGRQPTRASPSRSPRPRRRSTSRCCGRARRSCGPHTTRSPAAPSC
ncbi:MAG: CocE/NonD family hydrolase [Solirubrobacterales bacterium]